LTSRRDPRHPRREQPRLDRRKVVAIERGANNGRERPVVADIASGVHNHTEGFENDWKLIRETASSQKFRVTTEKTKIEVDIHYTAEKILTVNLVVEGSVTKSLLTPVMDEIGRLGLSRGDYAVIDYTLSATEHLIEGNYSIDKEVRKYRRL
jgi:hypothetical protein